MNQAEPRQMILIFSYGTLRQENVQMAIFGRKLEGRPDALPGYSLSSIRITDPHVVATSGADVHQIARPTGDPADRVAGMVLEITASELEAADRYEVGDYTRISTRLESGCEAFLYIEAGGPEAT
jgi:gamma-glutamylcyclotransferase (GGCT)/AIG2-like uncharacterized protein YtfP